MMLVRLIIFVVLISLVFFVYRKFIAKPDQAKAKPIPTSMKKCSQCGVHLPEAEAVKYHQHYFCNLDHQKTFLDQHPDE